MTLQDYSRRQLASELHLYAHPFIRLQRLSLPIGSGAVTAPQPPDLSSTEYRDLPKDSGYLILEKCIQTCPLCYKPFSPRQMTKNVKTSLIRTMCLQCRLPFYFVLKGSPINVTP